MPANPVFVFEAPPGSDSEGIAGKVSAALAPAEAFGVAMKRLPKEAMGYREVREVERLKWRRIAEIIAIRDITKAATDGLTAVSQHNAYTIRRAVGELLTDLNTIQRNEVHGALMTDYYARQIAGMMDEAERLRKGYAAALGTFQRQGGGDY